MRNIGIWWTGQSNQAGATLTDNGGVGALFTSSYTGVSDPLRLNVNGGGSCLPYLIDLGLARGVNYIILNGAIGGASVYHYSGIVGATVTGSATDPAIFCNMGSSGLSLSAGTACVEGDAQFDPFTFNARLRAAKALYPQITEWVGCWANAESDGGTASALYQAALVSNANYALASGVNKYLIGLSSSGNNSQATMDRLQTAYLAAIGTLVGQGKNVAQGADLYAKWGMTPPLYTEKFAVATKVHLTKEGQRVQAELWNAALLAAGY